MPRALTAILQFVGVATGETEHTVVLPVAGSSVVTVANVVVVAMNRRSQRGVTPSLRMREVMASREAERALRIVPSTPLTQRAGIDRLRDVSIASSSLSTPATLKSVS